MISGVTKRFGDFVALDGVDLEAPAGTTLALCGINGAGKTTLLRCCTGQTRPDKGRITVAGVDVWPKPKHALGVVGVVPDKNYLIERLLVRESLENYGLFHGVALRDVSERVTDLMDLLDFADEENTLVKDVSLGTEKKIAIAAALLPAPKVLVLDEPLGAIDAAVTHTIEETLRDYTSLGGTVIVSSHLMDVVERLCDRVAIIHHGHVIAAGEMTEFTHNGTRRFQDVFLELVDIKPQARRLQWLASSFR